MLSRERTTRVVCGQSRDSFAPRALASWDHGGPCALMQTWSSPTSISSSESTSRLRTAWARTGRSPLAGRPIPRRRRTRRRAVLSRLRPSWMVVDAVFIEVALMQRPRRAPRARGGPLGQRDLREHAVVPAHLAPARLRWRPRAWVLATILLQLGAIAPLARRVARRARRRKHGAARADTARAVRRQPAAARELPWADGWRAEPRLVVHGRRQRGRAHRGGALASRSRRAPRTPTARSGRASRSAVSTRCARSRSRSSDSS